VEAAFVLMGSLLEHLEGKGLISVQESKGEDPLPNVCSWLIPALPYGTILYSKLTG